LKFATCLGDVGLRIPAALGRLKLLRGKPSMKTSAEEESLISFWRVLDLGGRVSLMLADALRLFTVVPTWVLDTLAGKVCEDEALLRLLFPLPEETLDKLAGDMEASDGLGSMGLHDVNSLTL